MSWDSKISADQFFCENEDLLVNFSKYLSTKDLIMLSSACKTLRTGEGIWKILADKYHVAMDAEALIKYLNTPIEPLVYHLLNGVQRKSLSKNRYQVYPATPIIKIQKAAHEIGQNSDLDEEHCEFVLKAEGIPPLYSVRHNRESVIDIRKANHKDEKDPFAQDQLYLISESKTISDAVLPIYNAITHEQPNADPHLEVGPYGLFSLEGNQWKPLASIKLFQENSPIDPQIEAASLKGKSLLIITDIARKAEDTTPAHLIPACNEESVAYYF